MVEVGDHGHAIKVTIAVGQYLFQVGLGFTACGNAIYQALLDCQGGNITLFLGQSEVHIICQIAQCALR